MTRSLLFPYAASVASLALTAALSAAQPAQDPNLAVYGDALVRSWTMPQAPKGVHIGVESTVTVRFIVDASGQVTKARAIDSSDRKLNDAAIAALRQWKFSPALEAGHPIAECMDVQIMFDPADPHSLLPPIKPNPAPTTPPDVERQVDADYPPELNSRQLNGKVAFRCHVDAKGVPLRTVVLNATDAGFVAPAVAAVKHWEFTPAKQGDLLVAGDVGAELDFNFESGNPKDLLAANGITAPNGKPPKKTPILRSAPAPVLPYAAVAAGKGGDADVSFVLNDNGFPEQIKVSHASSSDCGASLVAAVQTWRFDPVGGEDGLGSMPLKVHWVWPADAVTSALYTAMQQGKVGTPRGLDHPLAPLFRRPPDYPEGAEDAGSAMIEGVICHDGRVRLVRVVKSSADAFGWAAAQAFSQWVFDPITKQGQPVDVRVMLPIQFPKPG